MISRQLKWRQKMKAAGRCIQCGGIALKSRNYCLVCWVKSRERQRKVKGHKARYVNAESYRLEQEHS